MDTTWPACPHHPNHHFWRSHGGNAVRLSPSQLSGARHACRGRRTFWSTGVNCLPSAKFRWNSPSVLAWSLYDAATRLLNEQPLACGPSSEDEVYRLIWTRTFHPPISIRIGRAGAAATITAVELKGAGGFKPGPTNRSIHRDLSAVEWNAAVNALERADVWRAGSDGPDAFGLDGSTWLLEGRVVDRCHVLYRWTPKDMPTRNVTLKLLELARFTVPSEQFY